MSNTETNRYQRAQPRLAAIDGTAGAKGPVVEDIKQRARSATHLAEGLALRERSRLKAAVACFEQTVAAQPDSVDGWFWQAVSARTGPGGLPGCKRRLPLAVRVVRTPDTAHAGPGGQVRRLSQVLYGEHAFVHPVPCRGAGG